MSITKKIKHTKILVTPHDIDDNCWMIQLILFRDELVEEILLISEKFFNINPNCTF